MATYCNPSLISSSKEYYCSYNIVKKEILICLAELNRSSEYDIDLSNIVYLCDGQEESNLVATLELLGLFPFSLLSTGHTENGSYHLVIKTS